MLFHHIMVFASTYAKQVMEIVFKHLIILVSNTFTSLTSSSKGDASSRRQAFGQNSSFELANIETVAVIAAHCQLLLLSNTLFYYMTTLILYTMRQLVATFRSVAFPARFYLIWTIENRTIQIVGLSYPSFIGTSYLLNDLISMV